MNLSHEDEEEIRLSVQRIFLETQILLVRVERDLKMLSSEFRPYLHEADAQLDQIRERIKHHELGHQRDNDKAGGQVPPATPAE